VESRARQRTSPPANRFWPALSFGSLFYLSSRIDAHGARMDARFDNPEARFDALSARFDALSARLDTRFDSLSDRLDDHIQRHAG
jgi:hypothetical protein